MTETSIGVADEDSLSGAFYDIAQVLESGENSEARVIRVLARLRSLVPYQHCAVLEALPGREPRLITPPETPPAERDRLLALTDDRRERARSGSSHDAGHAHCGAARGYG